MAVMATPQLRKREKKVLKVAMEEIKLPLTPLLKSLRKRFMSQWMEIPMMISVSLISRKE